MRARHAVVYSPLLMLCSSAAPAATAQDVLILLTNPVSTLSRVRADYDSDYDVGEEHEGTRQTFTLRPIIPIPLTDRWQLVSETRCGSNPAQRPLRCRTATDSVTSMKRSPSVHAG